MAYAIFLKASAEKELDRLPARIHRRAVDRLLGLKDDPRPPGCKKLHGHEGYRIRIGNYRILYVIDDVREHVEVYSVAHRKGRVPLERERGVPRHVVETHERRPRGDSIPNPPSATTPSQSATGGPAGRCTRSRA